MKLVIAIVRDDFCDILQDALTEKEFRYTKLASTGGFLRKGNTTLLLGVEDEQTDEVMKIIEDNCKSRPEFVTINPVGMAPGMVAPPIEIIAGGATVFVVDVVKFEHF